MAKFITQLQGDSSNSYNLRGTGFLKLTHADSRLSASQDRSSAHSHRQYQLFYHLSHHSPPQWAKCAQTASTRWHCGMRQVRHGARTVYPS